MNPKNGVVYAWKHIKSSTWPDQVFVGKLKIIYSSSDRRGICRTWLEEITRDNKFQSLTMSTACLNNKRTAEISVPACPIPTHQTKFVISQAHPTVLFNPHTPTPVPIV